MSWTAAEVKAIAADCGFELCGIAPAAPLPEAAFFPEWVARGFAGEMRYLTDHRAAMRQDPRSLLGSARSVICVGKLYQTPFPHTGDFTDPERAWISRYAWGEDYHDVLSRGLERLVARLAERAAFDSKICVDTAPLLERAYAQHAGMGWIGKNTCLINQQQGSWFFLGEVLTSLELPADKPPPFRCGTCTRCIDACPTAAIVPVDAAPKWAIDSRLCISYFTIELRGTVPGALRGAAGAHVFGCDICQDVCPWNRRAPVTDDAAFTPRDVAPRLEELAELTPEEFRAMFRASPVWRAKYAGFLRNVALAMGASGLAKFRPALERLAAHDDAGIAEHAGWALRRLVDNAVLHHE